MNSRDRSRLAGGDARRGDGECSASKSACASPSGSVGGHALCCFGVVHFDRFAVARSLPSSSSTALLRLWMPLSTSAGRWAFAIFARCDSAVLFGGARWIGLSSLGGASRGPDDGSAVRKDCSARQVVAMLEVIGFGEVG